MPEYDNLPDGTTCVRVNLAKRGETKDYRFFLKRDGQLLADGESFSEAELAEYLEQREARQHD